MNSNSSSHTGNYHLLEDVGRQQDGTRNVATADNPARSGSGDELEGKGYPQDFLKDESVEVTVSNVFNKYRRKSLSVPLPKASWGRWRIWLSLVLSLLLFFAIYYGHFMSKKDQPAEKALALLIFAAVLWATEAIPLWVTAMTIPFIIIVFNLQITDRNDSSLIITDKGKLATDILSGLISSNVVLIFGGFTLARALQKYKLDRMLALAVLSRVTNFKLFLLMMMLMGAFLSMWMSNVVAPALVALLIEPALKNADMPTGRCIAIAIAFSNNIGGMLTPIASPQNDIAIDTLSERNDIDVGFGEWIAIAMPLCVLHLTFIWIMLLWYYNPEGNIRNLKVENTKLDQRHYFIISVLFITVLLWILFKIFSNLWGCLGTIGLIPIISLYGTGVLDKKDLGKINWAILLLLGGGEALGRAIEDSSLLDIMATQIKNGLEGKSPWFYSMVFNIVVMVPTNFISHTVGAITMLPVVSAVALDVGQAGPLVIGAVLSVSGSCALPVSSFPNVISYSLTNGQGEKFLRVSDYVVLGVPTQIFVYVATTTLGWIIMQHMRFS